MQVSLRVANPLFAMAVAVALCTETVAAQTFTVTNAGSVAYVIGGEQNPDLTLTRGQTYSFDVSTPFHPFWIKSVQGATQENAYNDGVTNNGVEIGTLTFAVALNAPSSLFYNCEFHSAMTGTIHIVDPGPTATQTTSAIATVTSTPTSTLTASPTPTLTQVPCDGDCGGSGTVAIDDIVTLVNIALGSADPSTCPHGNPGGGPVTIDVIITAVNNALAGCP